MTQTSLPVGPPTLNVGRGETALNAPSEDMSADEFAAMLAACLDPACAPQSAVPAPVPGYGNAQLFDLPPASAAAPIELTGLIDSVAGLLDSAVIQSVEAPPTSPDPLVAEPSGGMQTEISTPALLAGFVPSPVALPTPPDTGTGISPDTAATEPEHAVLLPGTATSTAKSSALQSPVPVGEPLPELATSVESAPIAADRTASSDPSEHPTPIRTETGTRIPDGLTHLPSPQHGSGPRTDLAGRIETGVGSPRWGSELADRVTWMIGRGESRAELVLNPPQFGRLEISVAVKGDEASAVFVSGNAQVRESIEQALPRLREILAEAGVQLGQTSVSAESPRRDQTTNAGGSGIGATSGSAEPSGPAGEIARTTYGLVDTFV